MKISISKPVFASLFAVGLLLSCSTFPTQFGYIGDQYVQTVGFVFTNTTIGAGCAEGAPGDTMRLSAYFAGEPVRSYACSLSAHVSMTMYGQDTAYDFRPIVDLSATFGPDSIQLSFVIPKDFFDGQAALLPSLLRTIPDSVIKQFPFDVNSAPPSQVFALAGSYLTQTDFSQADPQTCTMAAHLAQLLAGRIALHLAVNGGYTISRLITVRYNTHIKGDPFVYVNNNPDPQWIGVYKVKNTGKLFFSPMEHTDKDTLFCLFLQNGLDTIKIGGPRRFTDTLLIDTGYSYYAIADSGIFIYDSATASGRTVTVKDTLLDRSFSYADSINREYYNYLWFYEPDSATAGSIKPENSLIIANSRDYFSQLLPPLDTAVKNVNLWLRISDAADGELNRPIATTMKETHVVLTYSQKYASTVKKK
jgi:hypothetical protein